MVVKNKYKLKKKSYAKKKEHKTLPYQLLDYAKENRDGFTVEVVDGHIKPYGYTKEKRFIVSTTNIKSKQEVIKNFSGFKNGIVGGWYDRKSDKYYIDKNIAVANESTANELGRKYKQKAIFDYLTRKQIDIPEERRISKRGKKKKLEKAISRDILKSNNNVQRYYVKGDMYEMGYFYDKKKQYWIHAKRFTFYSSRGFYRVDAVQPPQFFSTGLLFKKFWTGQWLPLNNFNNLLDRILRPNLSHRNHWYQCYKFFSYEYKRGYFYYIDGRLKVVVLEQYARGKS